MGFLPLDVGIVAVRLDRVHPSCSVGVGISPLVGAGITVVTHRVDRHVREIVVVEVLLACDAVAGAQLKFVKPAAGAFHETFVNEFPCESYRGERTPAVVLAEARCAVLTYGCGQQVAVHERVVQTSEERYEDKIVAIAACRIGLERVFLKSSGELRSLPAETLIRVAGCSVEARADRLNILAIVEVEIKQSVHLHLMLAVIAAYAVLDILDLAVDHTVRTVFPSHRRVGISDIADI